MLSIQFDTSAFNELERYAQAIPQTLLAQLNQSAQRNKTTLAKEIVTRVLSTYATPDAFNLNEITHEVMLTKFTGKEAFAENRRRRQGWLYLYEMEKLKLFLKFKKQLPKQFKESFAVVDAGVGLKKRG